MGNRSWTVAEGVLIGDSASLGGNVDVDAAATVVIDQAADSTLGGQLSGSGTLIKQNAGTLIITNDNPFTGHTELAAGGLQVDGVLPGTMTVAGNARLSGIGTTGSVTTLAGGFVAAGNSANPFGTLTISGDYSGQGTVEINTVLGNETSAASRLVIQGGTSGASSLVQINQVGGNGDQTEGDGIAIIQVDGDSPANSFTLAEPVQAGAFDYLLMQGGASDPNDWFLRSELNTDIPAFRPGVSGYALGHQLDLEYGFTALGNLRARVGDQGRVIDPEAGRRAEAWMRVYTHELDVRGARFAAQNYRMTAVQFGADIHRVDGSGEAGTHLGVMVSVGESGASILDPERAAVGLSMKAGEVEMDVKGGGAYWTSYGEDGGYLDIAGQLLHYDSRYRDQYLGSARQSGWGGTLSFEFGRPFKLGDTNWRAEPHGLLAYQRLELDDFEDAISTVGKVDQDGLRARAAVQIYHAPGEWLGMSEASPYVAIGLQKDFLDAEPILIGGTAIVDEMPDTTADLSVGFTGSVRPGLELHLDLRYQEATSGERDGFRGNFGFRMTF